MKGFTDTHAHLYVQQFDEDVNETLLRADEAGVHRIFLPNIDLSTTQRLTDLVRKAPERLFPMMGIHPCSVKDGFEEDLKAIEVLLRDKKWYGIGETGIDLYWDTKDRDIQEEAFRRHIGWAIRFDLPLIIHSRSALDVTISMVEAASDPRLRGIFHCFDGTVEQAKRIEELGFYIGIGGIVTYKNAHVSNVLPEVGLEHVVLETDSPYLPPVPYRGKRNESSYLIHIADVVANLMSISMSELSERTENNVNDLFEYKPKDEPMKSTLTKVSG